MRPEATRTFPSAMESTIVVASNRGPVSFERDESGTLVAQRGAGGLVTALSGVFFRDDTDVRREDRGHVAGVRRGEPLVRGRARRGGRSRSRLPDPGLPPGAGPR